MATIFSSEEELLNNLKRGGWQVVGRNPHMVDFATVDKNNNVVHEKRPDGNVVLSIIGPDGDPDEVVVGISGTGGPSTDYRYSVVEGPKKAIPTDKAAKDWRADAKWVDQPDGSKRWQAFNPATNLMEDAGGVAPVPATEKSKPAPEMKQVNGVWMQRPAGSADPNAWVNAGLPTETDKAAAPIYREYDNVLYQMIPDASAPGGYRIQKADVPVGTHPPGDFIENGFRVRKNWNEGTRKYEVDATVEPVAWSPEAKAQTAKLGAQAKEGDTRDDAIVGGFHVKQKYSGGDWITTEIGARATPEEVKQLTAGTDTPYIVQTGAQGGITQSDNPNYQGPKAATTRAEIAQRTALLQSQMQQMKDKIMADKAIPPDQQAARFATWYDQNVAPQIGALEQQQQAVMFDEAQKATELQRTSLASASSAMQGLMPYRVGPGYGAAFEKIVQDTANIRFPGQTGASPDLGTGWSTFKAPNLDEHIQNLVSNQPAAPGAMDIRGMLGNNQWTPGGAPPAAPGGAPPPGAPGPPADQFNSPLGAIGSNPMLAAIQARNRQMASQQTAAATANPNNSPFGAIGPGGMPPPMPPPAVMPLATGNEPLPYSTTPNPFSSVIPLLPGVTPQQFQNPYQWPFGGGGGGNAGFTPGP